MSTPALFTFDIFGTVIDWRTGLTKSARDAGVEMSERAFEDVIAYQAKVERGPYRSYAEILAESLVRIARMDRGSAQTVANHAGRWPLFPDAADGIRALMRLGPCVAMTNSDQAHGADIQHQLGFRMNGWICAEDVRCYKPSPEFWRAVSSRRSVPFGPDWWHVSAYADYDMGTAAKLGLTTVFVERPHCVWGPSTWSAPDLRAVAALVPS
jgi:2-haloalkanoic acid dehalogenase type II